MLLNFKVKGQAISVEAPKLVEGSVDYFDAEFLFSPEWTGLAKEAYFSKGETTYKIPLVSDRIDRSAHLNLSAGMWKVVCYGLDVNGTMIISTNHCSLPVNETLTRDGVIPPGTPASEIDLILQKSQNAENIAQSVRDDAKNGIFNGKSAYEIALENGFIGTEQEWLDSLRYDHSDEFTNLVNTVITDLKAIAKGVQTNADTASESARQANESASNAKASEDLARESKQFAHQYADETRIAKGLAEDAVTETAKLVELAEGHETRAKQSETNTKTSETNAKTSEDKAKISETNAKTSETSAKSSETNAKTSETNAGTSETNAKTSETNAKTSEEATKKLADEYKPEVERAVANADKMAEEASNVNIIVKQGATSAIVETTDRHGVVTTAKIDTHISVKDWGNVQMLVREGAGPELFPPGYIFNSIYYNPFTNKTYDYPWHVLGHKRLMLPNGKIKNGMVLQGHFLLPEDIRFDYYEAFYSAEKGLDAGTYHIVLPDAWSEIKAGDAWSFTLTKPVPAGGVLCGFEDIASYADMAANSKVKSYAKIDDKTPIETADIRKGAEGTKLGDLKRLMEGNMNSVQRVSYGYNNYLESFARQFLNSEGRGWYKSQNKFDRPPANADEITGFLSCIDPELLAVISPVKNSVALNTVTDNGEVKDFYDKVWLPSLEEMYITPQIAGVEGPAYEYWKEASGKTEPFPWYQATPELVHLGCDDKQPHYTWFRSANRNLACYVWFVSPSGYVNNYNARNVFRLAPLVAIV